MRTGEKHCFRQLFKYATLLINKHHHPLVVSYRDNKRQQKFFGSIQAKENAKRQYFRSIATQKVFDSDWSDLNMPGTYGHIDYEPLSSFFRAPSESTIEVLPFDFEWMRLSELGPWVTREIMRQYHQRGGEGKKPGFGKLL